MNGSEEFVARQVRGFPLLFDANHVFFRVKDRRQAAFALITTRLRLQFSEEELRADFRRENCTGAKEVDELEKQLGILELCSIPGSSCVKVQPACAITGEGLHEGLDHLYQLVLKRRKLAKLNRKRAR